MKSRGFSIVELLVSIAVIALLVAIVSVAVASVRRQARHLISMADLRQHAQIFSAYNNDNQDAYPRFLEPRMDNEITIPSTGASIRVGYFYTGQTWHLKLAQSYYNTSPNDPIFRVDDRDDIPVDTTLVLTPYVYPCVFIADPTYWNPETRSSNAPSQYRMTRAHEVVFPSAKSVVVQTEPFLRNLAESNTPTRVVLPTAFVDGSVDALQRRDRVPGYPTGDGNAFLAFGAEHFTDYPPLLHTVDGVRGRDR